MSGERIEVRCCCDPGRLLGTVPKPPHWGKAPSFEFLLPVANPKPLTVINPNEAVRPYRVRRLVLEKGQATICGNQSITALKSMNTPIETLREIRGWQDAE